MLKTAMNAEKMAAQRRMSNENENGSAAAGGDPRMMIMDDAIDFGHEAAENQLAMISTEHY